MNKKELWLNIANYHFDDLVQPDLWDKLIAKFGGQHPSAKAFRDKLSRKLNWNKKFAAQAIWEYKKFVFLGVVSDFSVTPSKVIDQVWHEHVLFSAGYRHFCNEIIRTHFDHNPELLASEGQTKTFQAQFYHTLQRYKKEFGIDPPENIWGETKFKSNPSDVKNLKKKREGYNNVEGSYDSAPLISHFPDIDSRDVEFGSGEFGGGGAGGSWADSGSDHSGGDSDGGSDSGSDGGSSCSSSCGGD